MKTTLSVLVTCILFASAYQQNKTTGSNHPIKAEKGMTKVSVMYPAGEGHTFNWDYYLNKHAPMVKSLLGDSLQLLTIDKGISGRTPGSPATYVAMFHMYFKSLSAYQNSLAPHADQIRKDIPNYTNIVPVIQISEVQW